MPRCPHCHEEIDNLDWSETALCVGFVVLRDKVLDYEEDVDTARLPNLTYTCPLCKQLITDSEVGAMDFLAGISNAGKVE